MDARPATPPPPLRLLERPARVLAPQRPASRVPPPWWQRWLGATR